MTLTDFLLARIAEDETFAEMVANAPRVSAGESRRVQEGNAVALPVQFAMSPARVLAECEAKRRIVEAFEAERVRRDIYNRGYDSGEYDFNENDLRARLASNAECRGLEIAMQAHAAAYADHPDYREEWKP